MADSRFFKNLGPFSVRDIADATGCQVVHGDPSFKIKDMSSLDDAGEGSISYMYSMKYKNSLSKTKASFCIIPGEAVKSAPDGIGLLVASDVKRATALALSMFYPPNVFEPYISDKAIIDVSASIGIGCRVDAGAIIGKNVSIGDGTWIKSGAVIGDSVVIGKKCVIGINASLTYCVLGNKVIIYAGVRIGEDGFGFALGSQGHLKLPQIGIVEIGDDVEIGANTCIDRGAVRNTVIGSGCRVDNLVQIGHNVKLGRGCYLVSQVGIAGSCNIGDFVIMGGQAGIADNLTIGAGSQIGAQSGLPSNLPPGSKVMGSPAIPAKDFFKQHIILQKIAKKEIEKGKK